MHLKKSTNLLSILLLSLPLFLSAQDESILSEDRLQIIDYNKKQNKENSEKLKKDWINPINLTYSWDNGETYDTTKSMISINQPIFRSGGIYNAIKYSDAVYDYNKLDIEIQRKNLIKDVTTILFNLNIVDLNINKNELLLKNAKIDIIRKKEQVLNGFLDTSFLDNAILDANKVKNTLAELHFQKDELINNFSNLASGEYSSFDLPHLILTDKENFLNKNMILLKAKADINQKDYFVGITKAKYLPSVNAKLDYTAYHDTDNNDSLQDESKNYGISITMPLDVRTFNDIESEQINYLKAKLDFKNKVLEETNFFKTKLAKIKMINTKKKIASDDYELYNSLLEVIVEEKNAELKTQSDVDTLANSQKIKSVEKEIYLLEEQIELLDLYSRIN